MGTRCKYCLGKHAATTRQTYLPFLGLSRYDLSEIDKQTQQRFYIALLATIAINMVLAPFVLLPGLLVVAISAAWRRVPGWQGLVGGVAYFIGAWLLVVPQLLPELTEPGSHLVRIDVAPATAWFLVLVALLLVPFLWRPAQDSAAEALRRRRGVSAGFLLGEALIATVVSVCAALLAVLTSI